MGFTSYYEVSVTRQFLVGYDPMAHQLANALIQTVLVLESLT